MNNKYFVGIKFLNGSRAYFFGTDEELVLGEKVVVETTRGMELGEVAIPIMDIKNFKSDLELKPILRKATETDVKNYQNNEKDAQFAMKICQDEVSRLQLDMNLISCEYTLDKAKIMFTYLADDRVDFRELLKVLASKLHTRIDLRQIGSRDKAKMIGGLGMCGLLLCCSTFLNEFDGISINRAKNQMLVINIPKLSGHCGKLMCCLKFEDDAYTELRKEFPELGTKVFIDKVEYNVTSLNVLSGVIKVENSEDVKFLSFNDFKLQTGWRQKQDHNNHEEK